MLHIWQEPNYLPEDDDDEMWDALQRDLYSWFQYSFKILNDEKQSKFHPEISEAILVSALNARKAGFKIPATFNNHILSCLEKYYVDPSKEKKPTLEKAFGLPKLGLDIKKRKLLDGERLIFITTKFVQGYKLGEQEGKSDKKEAKPDKYKRVCMDEFYDIDNTDTHLLATQPYQRYGIIIGYEYGYHRSKKAKLNYTQLTSFLMFVNKSYEQSTAEERIKTYNLKALIPNKSGIN
jgi:hypothetical protein